MARTTTATPRGAGSLPELRRLVFANQWAPAQDLANQTMLGNPASQLAYQPVGDLRLTLPAGGVSGYERWLDLTTATTDRDLPGEQCAVSA